MKARSRGCGFALVMMLGACGAEVQPPRDGGGLDPADGGGITFTPAFDGPRADAPSITSVGDAACANETVRGERLPLDLYLMLDTSLSMLESTSSGSTKWDDVKAAIGSFLGEPEARGLGLGLQYFPLVKSEVPAECFSDRGCGDSGPCKRARSCEPSSGLALCETQADCDAGQSCLLLGACAQSTAYCSNVGQVCGGGGPQNVCELIPGYCRGRDLCEPALYAKPEVAIAPLPGVAGQIIPSLAQRTPDGLTPTAPALAGALTHLQAHLVAHPDRRAAVVLATDGFPAECTPLDVPGIALIAAQAARATPPVPTFVIGVFSPLEAARATTNLDALALAGGTGKAFVISTGKDVNGAFLAALNDISRAALACTYKLPAGRPQEPVDLRKVNVQYTAGDGRVTTLGNVANKGACDPVRGGWYYDASSTEGGKPTEIVACDTTCNTLRMDPRGKVDIVLGCQTMFFE